MRLTSQQYAQALYDAVSQTAPHDHDKVMDKFVKILAENGDLGKHQEIENEYKRLDMQAKGIKEAEVTAARDIEFNSGLIDELNRIINHGLTDRSPEALAKGDGAFHKLEIKKKIDEGIVGGVIVKVDDTLIDASVKSQLNKLNQELKS